MSFWNPIIAGAALVAVTSAAPASAHHSFAMFDQAKAVTLKGQVVQFQWTNPHAFIELDVAGASGPPVRWSVELNSPNNLTRQGWRRSSLKAGDKVTLVLNPLRSGKKGGLFKNVTMADGRVLGDIRTGTGPINVPTTN
ncbi:MAG: DUF6152 family protein [Croceibacterium sp.]